MFNVLGQQVRAIVNERQKPGRYEVMLDAGDLRAPGPYGFDKAAWALRHPENFPVEVNLSPFQVDDEWFAVGTVRDIRARKKAEAELKEYVADLERFKRLVIGREERMIQLKEEINGLMEKLGGEKKYKIV